MNSNILKISDATRYMLGSLNCYQTDERKKIEEAEKELKEAVDAVKCLKWDSLFAMKDENRQELITCQQKVHETYAKLKRVMLETYKELFDAVKGL